jgi:hypothetical protein
VCSPTEAERFIKQAFIEQRTRCQNSGFFVFREFRFRNLSLAGIMPAHPAVIKIVEEREDEHRFGL